MGEASGIKRFIISVVYAVYSMANATTVSVLLIWVFIAPMIYGLAKKSELDFSHPVWAMVLLFGLYAALGMPCFYALGFAIPERNINLIYFAYYPVVLCAMFYLTGWFSYWFVDKLPNWQIGALYEQRFDTIFTSFTCCLRLRVEGRLLWTRAKTAVLHLNACLRA